MKYLILILIMILTITGCATKYPHCLKYAPTPDKPFSEFVKHPMWRDARFHLVQKMQTVNIEYGAGYELKYLDFLLSRGNITQETYDDTVADYKFYMPRK